MDRSRCGGCDWFLATDDADVLLRRRMCCGFSGWRGCGGGRWFVELGCEGGGQLVTSQMRALEGRDMV